MINHLLSIEQFDVNSIDKLFVKAKQCSQYEHGYFQSFIATNRIVSTNLFYEPSTRTSSSFYSAMVKLGGSVIPINDVSFSSVSKGETLEDTIRTIGCYCDVIVIRHPEIGSALRAAKVSNVPIINAGDGIGEHPTQALLDLYTISNHFDMNKSLKVALCGDLKHGRTVHSLVQLLRLYPNVKIYLVSPDIFKMPEQYVKPKDHILMDLRDCIAEVDVVYMTRVQKERIKDPYFSSNSCTLTKNIMKNAKENMIVMHPLPRVDELSFDIDDDQRAKYFVQVKNGLHIRQAIFLSLFEKQPWKNWIL